MAKQLDVGSGVIYTARENRSASELPPKSICSIGEIAHDMLQPYNFKRQRHRFRVRSPLFTLCRTELRYNCKDLQISKLSCLRVVEEPFKPSRPGMSGN